MVGFQSIFNGAKDLLTIWNLETGKCEIKVPMSKRFDSVFTFKQDGKTHIAIGFIDGVIIFI